MLAAVDERVRERVFDRLIIAIDVGDGTVEDAPRGHSMVVSLYTNLYVRTTDQPVLN